MRVYLVQHGAAKSKEEDPDRPLEQAGRDEVDRVARSAASTGVEVACIHHSGKTRARQTAEILADHLTPAKGLGPVAGLSPMDDLQTARDLVEWASEPVMLVGHLPHLARLASLLLSDDPEKEIIAFRMGGIVCLDKRETGWVLGWMLTPDLVPPT